MSLNQEIENLQNGLLLKRAFIRINSEKACTCENKTILVDTQNKVLECKECGAVLDPFNEIEKMMYNEVKYIENIKVLIEEKKELTKWMASNRMGILLKKWASNLRLNRLPVCPKCHESIDVYKVNTWRSN